jgi:hypothetical protein
MTDEQMERALEEGNVKFKELREAALNVSEPYVVCVKHSGGVHIWENCSEKYGNKTEDMKHMLINLAFVVADYIHEEEGEDAVLKLVGQLSAACIADV